MKKRIILKRFLTVDLILVVLVLFGFSTSVNAQTANVFPGVNWQEASPESQGVDSAKLQAAINYLKSNSGADGVRELVVIRNGYMVWKGNNVDKMHGMWSLTKSFTSTVLGLLIDEGKATLDTYSKDYLSSMSSLYPNLKLRHFASMTSGYRAKNDGCRGSYCHGPSLTPFSPSTPIFSPPGSKFAYWDSAMNQFANTLTRIANEPIENYFKRKIADAINMNRSKWNWRDAGTVTGIVVNGGSGNNNWHMLISTRELARFGYLFLNRGNWNGNQLISSSWVDQATSVQVPASMQIGNPFPDLDKEKPGTYGFNWWVNGKRSDGTRKWPDAPLGTYAASGFNNNDMFIIPEWNMVIVRLGLDQNEFWITDTIYNTFLKKVGEAIIPSDVVITGIMKEWQPITLSFNGPTARETDSNPNPFLDYRLQVTFKGPSGQTYNVPGFFDGNGNGAGTGNIWRVRFTPDEAGIWSYTASFRQGSNIAISLSASAGSPTSFDGVTGTFNVAARDANAPGFLSKGRLVYDGTHYLKTLGDGKHWIKGGTDSPEDFLGYSGFDNTPSGPLGIHNFSNHISDWKSGDPVWGSGKGKGIIGAINYLASKKVNSVYMLLMNIGGDGQNVYPYAGSINASGGNGVNSNRFFDISKLQQWEIVFTHMEKKGMNLHFVLTEGERNNKKELDNATLGTERKLFYREMIARFGHHNAITWNLSEEYDHPQLVISSSMIKSWAQYFEDVDPYDHQVTVHSLGKETSWDPFYGDSRFDVESIQINKSLASGKIIEGHRNESRNKGRKIPINMDESVSSSKVDDESLTLINRGGWTQKVYGQSYVRKNILYPVFFSGGSFEQILQNLLDTDDFRPYSKLWDYMYFARIFMENNLPFWEMSPADSLLTGEAIGDVEGGQVFMKTGEIYAIHLPAGGNSKLNLNSVTGNFEQRWYNPRTGSFEGGTKIIKGGSTISLGLPPASTNQDWTVLIRKSGVSSLPKTPTILQVTPTTQSVQLGQSFPLTYNWQGGPTSENLTVFVHFVDASSAIIFQDDHSPPTLTNQWSGSISYSRTITVPTSVAPGNYKILAGLFNPATRKRLNINPGSGVIENTDLRYEIGNLTVGTSTAPPPPTPNSADLNSDGRVDVTDLGILLSNWGGGGSADINNDGVIDVVDLGVMLSGWT